MPTFLFRENINYLYDKIGNYKFRYFYFQETRCLGKVMGDAEAFEEELAEGKAVIPTLEGFTLVTCVPAQVRACYR